MLARKLKPYGVKSKQARPTAYANPVRGYYLDSFADAFARYLPPLDEGGAG